jgi:hypothetical protein
MDRLPWSGFHTRVVVALGITWVLDGLEITIASLVGPVLQDARTLGLTSAAVGRVASMYLAGEVVGALVFGYLADRLGRRRLFVATLALYFAASAVTALAFSEWSLLAFRFFAGAGIGGEYAAINSAIDELIPARHRGHTDLAVNGTYWLGAILAAGAETARAARPRRSRMAPASWVRPSSSSCGPSGASFRRAPGGCSCADERPKPTPWSHRSNRGPSRGITCPRSPQRRDHGTADGARRLRGACGCSYTYPALLVSLT